MSDLDVEINYQIDLWRERRALARHERDLRIRARMESTIALNPGMSDDEAYELVMLTF